MINAIELGRRGGLYDLYEVCNRRFSCSALSLVQTKVKSKFGRREFCILLKLDVFLVEM